MSDRSVSGFWERVEKVALTGCWVWRGSIARNRYGLWSYRKDAETRTAYAHRFAYELAVGPIPDGLVLDHLCLNRTCCNPEHLDPVTHAENFRRGVGRRDGAAFQRSKTHCPYGHPYSGENLTIRPDGSRNCRACSRRHSTAARARRRAANPPKPRPKKQFCKNGHEFTPENTRVDPKRGVRSCRTCKRAQASKYRSRKDKQVVHRAEVCKNGHVMDEGNSHFAPDGARSCRACGRARARESYQRTQSHRGPAFAERTHCPLSHPYSPENTYVTSKGHRQCRTCNKAREIARGARKKAAAAG